MLRRLLLAIAMTLISACDSTTKNAAVAVAVSTPTPIPSSTPTPEPIFTPPGPRSVFEPSEAISSDLLELAGVSTPSERAQLPGLFDLSELSEFAAQNAISALSKVARMTTDEFETADQFERRRCEAIEKITRVPIGQKVRFTNLAYNGESAGYSAEAQSIRFETFFRSLNSQLIFMRRQEDWNDAWSNKLERFSSIFGLTIARDVTSSSYVGQNAFGYTADVERKSVEEVQLRLSKRQLPRGKEPQFRATVEWDARQAKAMRGKVVFVYDVVIQPPCIDSESWNANPTIDNPIEWNGTIYGIPISSDIDWMLFNTSNGEIMARGSTRK